ncbi:MAG TPA: PrsW family glutamic-type intramembrane protease [Pirellulaceae bacterium]
MNDPSPDPALEHEPHLQAGSFEPDASEELAQRTLDRESARPHHHDAVDHTVWEEPTHQATWQGPVPEGQLTYARWLDAQIAATSWAKSVGITLGLILCAGPWGILGALVSGVGQGDVTMMGFLAVVLVAPVTEEITKVAATLWVVEKRPFWFKDARQILLCAAAGGLFFAVIENLIYLGVYVRQASTALALWRWTVCSLLHIGCSFLVGWGLVAIWRPVIRDRCRPSLSRSFPYLIAAMVIHGGYNTFAMLGELTGWLKLGN